MRAVRLTVAPRSLSRCIGRAFGRALAPGLAMLTASAALSAADRVVDLIPTAEGHLKVCPINHATLVLEWNGHTIYVDPVGGAERFAKLPPPDLVLLTDIHGDHLDAATLAAVSQDKTWVVAPPAVAEKLSSDQRLRRTVLSNGQRTEVAGVEVEAVAAYNLTEERKKFHPKGRGNGYVLGLGGKRVYLSGDTEDVPEMRALRDIDVAFLCMNLPYTMTVDQAADAVRAFQPKIVYPYHSRGSDLEAFRKQVGEGQGVEVRLRDWYSD